MNIDSPQRHVDAANIVIYTLPQVYALSIIARSDGVVPECETDVAAFSRSPSIEMKTGFRLIP